jgi:hypothetical protein
MQPPLLDAFWRPSTAFWQPFLLQLILSPQHVLVTELIGGALKAHRAHKPYGAGSMGPPHRDPVRIGGRRRAAATAWILELKVEPWEPQG